MGLAPRIVEQVYEVLQEINRAGTTILLVEQNTHMALTVSHYAYILSVGRIVWRVQLRTCWPRRICLKPTFVVRGRRSSRISATA